MTNSFDIHNSSFGLRPVRQSKFDIRHCPRLWIQLFYSSLNTKGRAGFVMAISAFDARLVECGS